MLVTLGGTVSYEHLKGDVTNIFSPQIMNEQNHTKWKPPQLQYVWRTTIIDLKKKKQPSEAFTTATSDMEVVLFFVSLYQWIFIILYIQEICVLVLLWPEKERLLAFQCNILHLKMQTKTCSFSFFFTLSLFPKRKSKHYDTRERLYQVFLHYGGEENHLHHSF